MTQRRCLALCLSAPASNQGKTLIAAALARRLRNLGLRVKVFKAGPDFLDPMLLERACGASVYNLDGWMGGIEHCRGLLYQAAGSADFILLEGVMGLFDGPSSTADLALAFDLPVAAVIDATGMGQSFGALALGLASYRPELRFGGALANGVASARHEAMIREGMAHDIAYLGSFPRNPKLQLPSRHLGLVQAAELAELDVLLDEAAAAIANTGLADVALPVTFFPATAYPAQLPNTVDLSRAPLVFTTKYTKFKNVFLRDLRVLCGKKPPPPLLQNLRIAIARDAAFSFIYPANLDCLRSLGAELLFFSPLKDACLPDADAVYLPGGYPELHLTQLAENTAMQQALRQHAAAGKAIYAECGGLLYLLESLTDADGQTASMTGLLPGRARMGKRLAALGYQSLMLPQGTLRGHTFHYSTLETPLPPALHAQSLRGGNGEVFYRHGSIQASYLHGYFPSAPAAAAGLFRR